MKLSPTENAFVKHCGEMSGRWGVNRTVGQIFALLYISEQFISADDIVAALGCSRSNVSMGLKELASWHLVRLHHVAGDRREYFSTLDDVWDIVRVIADERRRREVDPTIAALLGILKQNPVDERDRATKSRLREMYEVIDFLAVWSDDVRGLPTNRLLQLLKLGRRAARLLRLKSKAPAAREATQAVRFGHEVMQFHEPSWPQPEISDIG